MAGVDDAESVAFGVGQHDEVSISEVVPRHASCAKSHKPVDLGRLLGRTVDDEIEMDPRPLLDRSDRPMHSDPCSDAVGRNQDREVVTGAREPDDFIAQHVGPEAGGTIGVVGTQDDRPEAQHHEIVAQRCVRRFVLGPPAERRPASFGASAVVKEVSRLAVGGR